MTRKMSEIMRRLAAVEERQARQDTTAAPSCVFLSSGDFDSKEDRETERARLEALYGDKTLIILFDLVGPAGTPAPIWKGDPEPSTEEILASREYRKAERQYFRALAGPDPGSMLETMTDSTFALIEAGVIAHDQPDKMITPPPIVTARQTSIAPLPTHEDTSFEQDPPARPLPPAPVVYSGGRLRDEDEEPDFQWWTVADAERAARVLRGQR